MKGIDGTSNGWIAAEYDGDSWSIEFAETLEELEFEEALIDMPVGLPDDSERRCDIEARSFLSPERHYSIFSSPVKEAVHAESYEEACDINEEKTGKRITKQAWNICPKIREVQQYSSKLEESHPEVFFKSLKEDSVKHSKRSEKGIEDRRTILEQYGELPDLSGYPTHDILDAMVLALGELLELEPIPENPDENSEGIEMKIMQPFSR